MDLQTEISINTGLSVAAAAERLREAVEPPRLLRRVVVTRVRLQGTVDGSDLKLYRSRGGRRGDFLRFEGQLVDGGDGAILEGRLVRPRNPIRGFAGFLVLWGALAIVGPIMRWRDDQALGWLMGGTVATAIGLSLWHLAPRFWDANVTAEREFLIQDIKAVFRPSPGAQHGRHPTGTGAMKRTAGES